MPKSDENKDEVTTDNRDEVTSDTSGDVDVSTDVAVSTDATTNPDLSTGQGVGDVKSEDVPNILDTQTNLPPDVRAALIEKHPVTPGAQKNTITAQEQPMPVVTGTADGSSINDLPIKRYHSDAHPELIVWHPNGDNTIQFHNGEFATANPEWQAILDATPEVNASHEETEQSGALQIDKDGHVTSLGGADVEPVRA